MRSWTAKYEKNTNTEEAEVVDRYWPTFHNAQRCVKQLAYNSSKNVYTHAHMYLHSHSMWKCSSLRCFSQFYLITQTHFFLLNDKTYISVKMNLVKYSQLLQFLKWSFMGINTTAISTFYWNLFQQMKRSNCAYYLGTC